ncbi:hypothetical protein O7632_18225 [Solwaraspora sp. WMMD406]|uniref:hypothetical protein n=1 Tax=Solwaraspora sp. WMMD406 TaxID=3016095 RepID=UPI002417E01C|nr:hypothetical protein [Solwaraspora sp. WMMD406]MDG4766023.1 hypothetical protein [Solwaraspora sp. WMMD406]
MVGMASLGPGRRRRRSAAAAPRMASRPGPRRALPLVAVLVAVLVVGACQAETTSEPPPGPSTAPPLTVRWEPVSLPDPPPGTARVVVRELTWCAGHWYAVGADVAADATTSPAAWHSADSSRWRRVPTEARSHYGRLNILSSAACRDGRLAAVGAMSGGAHGNPRTSSWRQRPDGTLVEVEAGFELFGGPAAVNVGRIVAAPGSPADPAATSPRPPAPTTGTGGGGPTWLIVGNRISGAAVWTSDDAAAFDIVEARPGLASDDQGRTWAYDALADGDGWLLAGALTRPGRIDRDPLLWHSTDGQRWQRTTVDGGPDNEELQRLVNVDGAPVAAGLHGDWFAAWRDDGDGWRTVGTFGSTDGSGVPQVRSLTASGAAMVAVTTTGADHRLWFSPDAGRTWRELVPPAPLPAGADRVAAVAAGDGHLLLGVDDGVAVTFWTWPIGAG